MRDKVDRLLRVTGAFCIGAVAGLFAWTFYEDWLWGRAYTNDIRAENREQTCRP